MANTRVTNPVTGFNSATEEGLKLPSGTNANQPTGVQGMIRNDTGETTGSSASAIEHHNGTNWQYFAATESADNPNLKMNLDASNTTSYPGTGTTWLDLTSNNNNGTISGATWNSGGYFDFDGSNDFVSMPAALTGTSPATTTVWANFSAKTNNPYIIQVGDITGNAAQAGRAIVLLLYTSGDYIMLHTGQTGYNTGFSPNVGDWNHYAVTYTGTSIKFYVNSSLQFSTSTASINLTSITGYIGKHVNSSTSFTGSFLNGNVSKLRLYDEALTQLEITALYNEGR